MKTFLKRLKTLFRPARKPFDKAAFEQRYEAAAAGHKAKMQALDAKLAIISTRLSADHQSASDAVSAAWVREEIAKGNAAALKASHASADDEYNGWSDSRIDVEIEDDGRLRIGDSFYGPAFDADKLATTVMEHFATREAEKSARIAELEAERDDLTDELESVRGSFKDRWSSVLPQPRVIVVTGSDDERAHLLSMLGISDRSEELTVTEVFERLTRLKGGE